MALPFKDNPYYKMSTLNKWFAISSIILLGTVIWALANDYLREWKTYQRDYRNLEVKKTQKAYQDGLSSLEKKSEYKAIQKNLEKAQADLNKKSQALEKEMENLKTLEVENYRFNKLFNFAKAEWDVAKFHLEDAGVHGGDVQGKQLALDQIQKLLEGKRKDKEGVEDQIAAGNQRISEFKKEISEIEKEKGKLARETTLLKRKLLSIDFSEMTLGNKMADLFRNLPMVDFMSPSIKIQQVVIKDITDDVKFMKVPKVDRCMTCHQGMENPVFEKEANPFKAHPNLDLFLSSNSPHPVDEFGCTVCHSGRGRGTDFVTAVHVAKNETQKTAWEEKHHYHKMHLWEEPMFPLQYTEAGCFQCHSNETRIKGADKLSLGLALIDKAGCYGCHNIEPFKGRSKRGPDLTRIASKDFKDWVFRWIKDPQGFRHTTWMPSFFNQSNNSDPESVKRNDQEIHSMVHYLWANSEEYSVPKKFSGKGNAKRGEELVSSVGCLACHEKDENLKTRAVGLEAIRRQHGPNLTGLGSKTSADWLFNWLKNPPDYSPHTKMPDFRLTNQEAADITAHLISNKNESFMNSEIPAVDEGLIDKIIIGNLSKLNSQKTAEGMVAKMDLNAKLEWTGKKMIGQYGCFGCHEIKGFEKVNPIGADLTEVGSKPVHKLDFGYQHLDHSNYAWFNQKLKNPRAFDKGFLRKHSEKLKMPNFNFSDSEIEAVVTALLGFKSNYVKTSKRKPKTINNLLIAEGQKLIQKFNCQGCHIIEGDGGAIQPMVTEWLVQFEGKDVNDAKALTASFSPPNLIGEGKKVQTDWLYHFMTDPEPIRPWLKVRMPTFKLTDREKNTIIKYFSALDDEDFPFVTTGRPVSKEYLAAGKVLFSGDYLNCGTCHIQGKKMPAGTPDRWAPDFAMSKRRLKPDWIVEWLKDPISLLPGTKMPSFYDPLDLDGSGPQDVLQGKGLIQIEALRDYVNSIN